MSKPVETTVPSAEQAEQPVARAKLVEAVTKAILFEDCGSTEDWEENTNLAEAAIRVCDARNPPRCSYCHARTSQPVHPSLPSAEWVPTEQAAQLVAWVPMAKVYCCYGMYAEVGHSKECPTLKAATQEQPSPDHEAQVAECKRLAGLFANAAVDMNLSFYPDEVRKHEIARAALFAAIEALGEGPSQ